MNMDKRHLKALSTPVMITCDEIDRLVINRLIQIRNADVNKDKDLSYIDKSLRFFLTEDEFKEYVVGNRKVKY